MREYLHPMDAARIDLNLKPVGLSFPPTGWNILQEWGGNGYALQDQTGLRLIVDCSMKDDDQFWLHVSVSRAKAIPSHLDMARVKEAFIGQSRYAYAVYPPRSEYVNIHPYCLHLWAIVTGDGRVLPEFSSELSGVKSI